MSSHRPAVRRAALIARRTLPAALDTLRDAADWLDTHGCVPVIERESAAAAGLDDRWPTAARAALAGSADVVIAFGGDGTLLDAARAVAHATSDVPVVGINLGRLGFLTEVGRAEMTEALEALLAGRTHIETRLMLMGVVRRDGTVSDPQLALNDIVVTRGALSRMIEMDVHVDGQFVSHVKADGLIIATATGSTAYNLSAGGPIVHPSVDALVLTPIAPHTLTHRPLVLPASARIDLHPRIDAQADLLVTFDGQLGVPLTSGDVVETSRAPRQLRFLRTSTRTHFDMLREKLKWGNS
jgi:NAD+ kinase